MNKKVAYLLMALVINFILAIIVVRLRRETLPANLSTIGYITGYAIVYWLRPFLFVGLVRLFFLLTNRAFTLKAALGVYVIAWGVMLVGMFYI